MGKKKAAHARARPKTGYGIHVASQLIRVSGGALPEFPQLQGQGRLLAEAVEHGRNRQGML